MLTHLNTSQLWHHSAQFRCRTAINFHWNSCKQWKCFSNLLCSQLCSHIFVQKCENNIHNYASQPLLNWKETNLFNRFIFKCSYYKVLIHINKIVVFLILFLSASPFISDITPMCTTATLTNTVQKEANTGILITAKLPGYTRKAVILLSLSISLKRNFNQM
jgi:hypothetical protein